MQRNFALHQCSIWLASHMISMAHPQNREVTNTCSPGQSTFRSSLTLSRSDPIYFCPSLLRMYTDVHPIPALNTSHTHQLTTGAHRRTLVLQTASHADSQYRIPSLPSPRKPVTPWWPTGMRTRANRLLLQVDAGIQCPLTHQIDARTAGGAGP